MKVIICLLKQSLSLETTKNKICNSIYKIDQKELMNSIKSIETRRNSNRGDTESLVELRKITEFFIAFLLIRCGLQVS